jgi:PAS domain S-box-containing protein
MPIDALQLQLASAVQRFHSLERRIPEAEMPQTKLIGSLFKELQNALEEVRVAQEQLIEGRTRMEALQAELREQYQKYWELFDEMPQAYVVTRHDSTILEVNRAASALFNVSQRFLVGKTLSVFVSDDRVQWLGDVRRAAEAGGKLELSFRLRPRERAAIVVQARVAAEPTTLRWVITAAPKHAEPGPVS